MNGNRIASAAIALVFGSGCYLQLDLAQASDSFSDDFVNADPTSPAREPVAWNTAFGGTIAIENGDLIVSKTRGLSGAGVTGFTAENLSIESQFRIVQGTNAGIALRVQGENTVNDCYLSDISATTAQIYRCGPVPLTEAVPVKFDATQQDVVMRLQAVDDELSLWVWPAGGTPPVEPLATAHHSDLTDGGIGVYVSPNVPGPTQALFRYFNVSVIPDVVYLAGDTDNDGIAGEYADDFLPIQLNFRKAVNNRSDGDLVANGVDLSDFIEWKTAFLQQGGSLAGIDLRFTGEVPEPSTWLLTAIGVSALMSSSRRTAKRVNAY
jgi:hypothetical protein